MKASAIVYTSNTGFTAQYATLLAHQTGLPLFRLEDSSALAPGTEVLFLGWLCAGKIQGLKKAMGRFFIRCVCAVGMAPSQGYAQKLAHDLGLSLPLYYLRGGYAPARIRGRYRLMMAMMKAILSKKTDTQSREALKAIELGADWVSAQQLEPVMDWLRK
ncbi:hypothetical protein [uncultured Flavonifractor sp.]|uniref:hypothetical protein n=1 Tax=uncultured Flavonifractor sp. TaxID=1193534 RepID=UPI00261C3C5C|nr:hypothetical protein [uncultured Flavonifractor sp.]